MNRLKRELQNRGICYEADDYEILMKGAEYDCCEKLVSFTSEIIITAFCSAVIDPILRLYDAHTLAPIGEQDMFKDPDWFGKPARNPWGSHGYEEVFL